MTKRVKNILMWIAAIYILGFCVTLIARAQIAPARDLRAEKPSPAILAKGTQPTVDPIAPPRALPEESLGDVARRNRATHPMTIDVQDFRIVCRDWTPGETCIIQNKPAPQPVEVKQ